MKPRMKVQRTLIAVMLATLTLSGCGQKGNLYLPNQKKKVPATQTAAPPVQPAVPAPDASSGAK